MKKMTEEIMRARDDFEAYIIREDITHQEAADRVGWKRAASVSKFLAGKHVPNIRRLYRIKLLVKKPARKAAQAEARG